MDIADKINLIKNSPTEEIVTESELLDLLNKENHPKHYIGLEMSGPLHLGSLFMTGNKINDFIKAGVKTQIYLADWHSFINDKLGGNWDNINALSEYYERAFKFFCPGVNIVRSTQLYEDTDYWMNLIKFCKKINFNRILRCLTIMGRSEKENLDFSQYLYPSMQAVDIKTLDLDIVHSGTDQRKIHMLVREVFPKLGWKVPVSIHHHIISGLSVPDAHSNDSQNPKSFTKMSKSQPDKSIFINDSEEIIHKKIKKTKIVSKEVVNNPVLEYAKYVIFHGNDQLTIDRPPKFGGSLSFDTYSELEQEYRDAKIHPEDLKNSVATNLNSMIDPIRKHLSDYEKLLQ